MSDARERHIAKMEEVKQEIRNAGVIHRKDLQRHLRRLERELRDYDKYRKAVGTNV